MSFHCKHIPCQVHATCVVVDGRGLLIVGRSGAGKSALALQLMAFGATLVADDYCDLTSCANGVMASRPDSLPEAIEARSVGLLAAPCAGPTLLAAVLDLDCPTDERLPALQYSQLGDHEVPYIKGSTASHLPAALFHFLKHGFHASMWT